MAKKAKKISTTKPRTKLTDRVDAAVAAGFAKLHPQPPAEPKLDPKVDSTLKVEPQKSDVPPPATNYWPHVGALAAVLLFAVWAGNGFPLPGGKQQSAAINPPAVTNQPVGGAPAAAPAQGRLKVGDTCQMTIPYLGETGYVWSDGRCHKLDTSYDPGSVRTAQAQPAPAASAKYKVGDTCPMSEPYKGQQGYVWADGRCHSQQPK